MQVVARKGSNARMALRSSGDQVNPKRSQSAAKNAATIHARSASKIHTSSLRVFIFPPSVLPGSAAAWRKPEGGG